MIEPTTERAVLMALRVEILRSGIRQREVAEALGWTQPRLSKALAGERPLPAGFEDQVRLAIAEVKLAKAEARLAAAGISQNGS